MPEGERKVLKKQNARDRGGKKGEFPKEGEETEIARERGDEAHLFEGITPRRET